MSLYKYRFSMQHYFATTLKTKFPGFLRNSAVFLRILPCKNDFGLYARILLSTTDLVKCSQ